MKAVGAGVKEIRVRDAVGAFRVIYLAARAEAVYVLHCFQRKTGKTRKADIDLAANRLRQIGGWKGAQKHDSTHYSGQPQRISRSGL
jgi:phage-related protein